jgi:integrase/recombinase XerD
MLLFLVDLGRCPVTITDEQAAREAQKAFRRAFSRAESPAPLTLRTREKRSEPRESFKRIAIYTRQKNAQGKWRYVAVQLGPGKKTGNLVGPFFLRYTANGKQTYSKGYETLDAAKEARDRLRVSFEAQQKGLTVAELDEISNVNRVPIRQAIEEFLALKKARAPRTLQSYRLSLENFQKSLSGRVRFLDEITVDSLRHYKDAMVAAGLAGKTVHNRLLTVMFLLKKHGIKNPLPWDEMPIIEEEPAVPFTSEELKNIFAAMNPEELIRYKFFLGTGCRDREVTFAAWQDLDLTKRIYHVRRKEDVGFTPKGHESRAIPLPGSLAKMLAERRKKPAHPRWIFVNERGEPDNHFLRKLKRIALRAGLNCGNCATEITKSGGGHFKKKVAVTCKTDPVCKHWYLHRFRKSCATRWSEAGIPVRTIQQWLGHKDLTTTVKYLGLADLNDPRVRSQVDTAFGD